MAHLKTRFASINQEWETPPNVFDPLDEEFHFTFDLAANEHNHKCAEWFDKEDDAMKQEWPCTITWLNPPYGEKGHTLKDWVVKSYNESKKDGCEVVMLIPARCNTCWWADYVMKAGEVRFICGRPKFSIAGNAATHGLPQPLAIVVFNGSDGSTKFSSFVL